MSTVIQHLRSALLPRDGADLTDGQLLECFVSRRETAALEALVRRHGPMVWGVCRRILCNHHDAEDAFQATFLVLLRKAASVKPREMVGNWLYGVARQTALKARTTAVKQRTRERHEMNMPDPPVKEPDLSDDWQRCLDQELSRLPDKYRVAIVLCDLEAETRKEAARQLGVPEGTLAGRLTRGRAMLAKRLARHGLPVTGGALAAVLSRQVPAAGLSTSVLSSTIKAVTRIAAGKTPATGLVSAKVAALTAGVLKAMLLNKLKTGMSVLLVVLGLVAFGGGLYLHRAEAQQGPAAMPPVAEDRVKTPQKTDKKRDQEIKAKLSSKKAQWKANEVPTFDLALHNQGQKTFHGAVTEAYCDLQVDGKWYKYRGTWPGAPLLPLKPGAPAKRWLAVSLGSKWLEETEVKKQPDREGKPIHLAPGKHTIRVAYRMFRRARAIQIDKDTPDKEMPEVRVVTNAVEIEITGSVGNQFPAGWGGGGEDYEIRVDRTVKHGGKASGSVKSIATRPTWYGALTQAIKADDFRGRRLRMTAYVKSRDVEGSAGLWMRIEGIDAKGNYSLSDDYMGSRPIKGTSDWKQYEVVLDVPQEGFAQICFGALLAGKGQVWVDDFKLEAVDKAVQTTGTAHQPVKGKHELAQKLPKKPRNLDFEQ
jgi:RNA polymerase sigma factor (sigma-70 family)